ncbi:hypothetical protein A4U49_12725 [Acidithiobacillus ferrivorans]|nr:hypothetical protein A4U49_12725 [Acidithiobacillus ferrivorans]
MPADWSPAKRRQKDLDATWTKKHGKSTYGFKLLYGCLHVCKRIAMSDMLRSGCSLIFGL